ncbi:hypothetical protein C1645_743412 [Glomus cerebriforme]|uniref:Retrotransposon gag domain-containing protein n=1 Tax=Glomus cerebriforme TaxID=658196 RepID=A0A397SAF8_9GLOM|nr:hypothetical protein C1645_743412 [Glomus cerebriforme]
MTRFNNQEKSKLYNITSTNMNKVTSIENETSSDEDSSNPCFYLPPLFYGNKTENVNEWLKKFEIVAKKNKWNEEIKLDISRSSLRGLAKTWYIRTAKDFQKTSWSEFSKAVRCYFQHNKYSIKRSNNYSKYSKDVFTNDLPNYTNGNGKFRSLTDELRNCKQESEESVESYGKRVYDLIEMVNINKTMCDVEMAVNLIKGLRADLCKEVVMLNPNTFNQALKFAKIAESKKVIIKCKEKKEEEKYFKVNLKHKNFRQNRTNWAPQGGINGKNRLNNGKK